MSETKFTPGPWVFNGVVEGSRDYTITFGRFCIASVHNAVDFPQMILDKAPFQQAANTHLIAAAPELYEALSKCREWVKLAADHPAAEPGVYEALSALEAAIAKARGELP